MVEDACSHDNYMTASLPRTSLPATRRGGDPTKIRGEGGKEGKGLTTLLPG